MKRIDEIIIISDYDSSYGLTVWFKGKDQEESKEAREIYNKYSHMRWGLFLAYVYDTYECDILLCCDGDIQYFNNDQEETP